MIPVWTLLRFLLVDGLLTTALLMLALTFGVHLLFAWMPEPVTRQYVLEIGGPEEQDFPTRLRGVMESELHTQWLRGGGARRREVTEELLVSYLRLDMGRLVELRRSQIEAGRRDLLASYGEWLVRLARRDLGTGRSGLRVVEELRQKAPLTLKLAATAYFLSLWIGAFIALVRTARAHCWSIRVCHYLGYFLTTLPAFFLGYLLIALFHLDLSERPNLLLAVLTLTFSSGILNEVDRMVHHSMNEQMASNYIATAKVKGLRRSTVLPLPGSIAFHAFRQAAVHFLPRLATRVPMVLGMSILVEKIFVLDGLGDMLIDGLALRDEARVLVVVVMAVGIVQVMALITRGCHLLLNPRAHLPVGGRS